jgi:hypothetical protein
MRKLALLLVALLPVSIASAAGTSPLILCSGTANAYPSGDGVVQRLDGSGRVSLTGGAGNVGGPVWSPARRDRRLAPQGRRDPRRRRQ